MKEKVVFQVARYRPEQESEPTIQEYEVAFTDDWVLLDALNHIKDDIDGSLSYRWSCRMGICGSCGMMVNGEPKLTCATFVSEYSPGPVRIEPLRYFPIIRDLTVDTTDFLGKLKSVKPWIIREDEKPVSAGEYLQSPAELDQYKQFSMCINCMLCYAACPVYGLDPTFTGAGCDRPGSAVQQGFTGSGIAGAARRALGPRRSLGLHVCRRVHQGVPEERRPGRGYSTV